MHNEGYYTTPDGLRIWHGLLGRASGPSMVLCDGIACDGFIWAHLADHFEPNLRLVRFHYRAHGRSDAPVNDDGLRLECLANDCAGVMSDQGIDRAVIAGHSMGVQVALEIYRHHPDRVKALVLLSGSYGHPLSTFQGTSQGERVLPLIRSLVSRAPRFANGIWARVIPTELAFRLARWTEIHPTLARRAEFFPYLQHAARLDLRNFLGMLTHAAAHTAEDLLPQIAVPTLVIAGENDGFTPAELSRHMAEQIPGAELLLLPGGTHTAPIEFPEVINERLEQFLHAHGLLDDDAAASEAAPGRPR